MFRFNFLLRFLLIVAFCLDGSAALWSASSMAASMVRHGADSSHAAGGHDDVAVVASADEDCPDGEGAGQEEVRHENCDCSSSGCPCPTGFTNVTVGHTVPFVAQHLASTALTMPEPASVVRSALSPVFRPPIG